MEHDRNPDMFCLRRAQGGYIVTTLDPCGPVEDPEEELSFREHIALSPEGAALMLYRYLVKDIAEFSPTDDELKEAIGISKPR